MKHLKKFTEGWFCTDGSCGTEAKSPTNKVSYQSSQVKAMGNFSEDEVMILTTIDLLRDNGFDLYDASGELTDGADVWTTHTAANEYVTIKPDYNKKVIKVLRLKDLKVFGYVNFSTPEQMVSEISEILRNS
jgi:hypothetical protein